MKTKTLILLSLIPALLWGTAGDIKIDRKNSSDNAWISTIFSKANSGFIGTDSNGVPIMLSGISYLPGTTTGQLILPIGSVGTPSLTFLGDTNTGLYWSASDLLGFSSGGSQTATASATSWTFPSTLTSGLQLDNLSTSASNFERLQFYWSSNTANISLLKGGTGASRSLALNGVNGGNSVTFGSAGNLLLSASTGQSLGLQIQGATWLSITPNTWTGGAGNTTIIAGTGASRTLTLQSTTSGSTATTFLVGNADQTTTLSGKISSYNGVATAGWGAPAIYKAGRVTAQSAANSSISTYTVGAADGSFEVSANMNVTAVTTLVTTLTCTYTDESNTARTLIFPVTQLSGSFIAAGAITGLGAWETPVLHIRCKAATAITILTSTGTFTGVTYTAEGIIKQTN